MKTSQTLPTTFAISLGEISGILLKHGTGADAHEYMGRIELMKAFQQMAVTCSFEESLIAFHGFKLSDEQLESLKIIYKSTKPWMLGHVVGVLLEKLDSPKITNKDFAESVRTIVDQLTETEGGKPVEKVKGLMVTLTK